MDHTQFEDRKRDHIRLALEDHTQASGHSGLQKVRLIHEALPDLNFSDIQLTTPVFSQSVAVPLFVSSMTAGHRDSQNLNALMARVCAQRNWAMGVGSQRRELHDEQAQQEWREVRRLSPDVVLFGNIGISQLIGATTEQIRGLVDNLQATALFVHTNPLQECLQPEGTPQFKGCWRALEKLVRELNVPVVVKETGCGFSVSTLRRLNEVGVAAVDVSGLGGTHWGRVEGGRVAVQDVRATAAETFADWGISTVDSLKAAVDLQPRYQVWASGGIRSGLDAAKCLAMGAQMVGLAQPIIKAALQGEEVLNRVMMGLEYELKMALFCTGSTNLAELKETTKWEWVPRPQIS